MTRGLLTTRSSCRTLERSAACYYYYYHERYNSREVGAKVAEAVLQAVDPLSGGEYASSAAGGGPGGFVLPRTQSAVLLCARCLVQTRNGYLNYEGGCTLRDRSSLRCRRTAEVS